MTPEWKQLRGLDNLNRARVGWAADSAGHAYPDASVSRLTDYSIRTGDTRVYFRDLAESLVAEIRATRAQHGDKAAVVGCVAWLTHPDVLRELATVGVNIAVQKEDFLRPDVQKLPQRRLYEALYSGAEWRSQFEGLVGSCSPWQSPLRYSRVWWQGALTWEAESGRRSSAYHGPGTPPMRVEMGDPENPYYEPSNAIRCVGNHNANKSPAHPRMHHKFLVFGSFPGSGIDQIFAPDKVWTGSFNFTLNGGRSLENAVVLQDPAVVRAYYLEFCDVFAISEPLDWDSPWCAPEWRVGT